MGLFKLREVVHLRPLDPGPLTWEVQEYYQDILEACFGVSEEKRYRAYLAIQHDPSMLDMAKFISTFVFEQVQAHAIYPNMRNMKILMKIVEHLVRNENIVPEIKQCLHQIMPSVMTCIVCSTLSAHPLIEDHWKLRMSSAELLLHVCDNFASPVNQLKERVIKVLLTAIRDETKDLSTLFGGLFALKTLGFDVIKPFISYIETDVKERVDTYTQPLLPERQRSAALRIKDLISQISTMEATAASIPKVKARIINRDPVKEVKSSTTGKSFGVLHPKRSGHKKKFPAKPAVVPLVVPPSPDPVSVLTPIQPPEKPSVKPMPIPRVSVTKEKEPKLTPETPAALPKVSSSSTTRSSSTAASKKRPELVAPSTLFHTYVKAKPRPRMRSKGTGGTGPTLRSTKKKRLSSSNQESVPNAPGTQQEVLSQTKSLPTSQSQSFITVTCPSATSGPTLFYVPRVLPTTNVETESTAPETNPTDSQSSESTVEVGASTCVKPVDEFADVSETSVKSPEELQETSVDSGQPYDMKENPTSTTEPTRTSEEDLAQPVEREKPEDMEAEVSERD